MSWQTIQLPLAAGLNQKADSRALEPPHLSRAVDVQFDEIGGIQTRYPYGNVGVSIAGGGTLSDIRKIVENGSELLCFTKEALYSWSPQNSVWNLRGSHLAVAVSEESAFTTTGDQTEADRAELDGVVVYAWKDPAHGVYAAAVDKESGAVLMAPTFSGCDERPRLVALDTKILLFAVTGDPDFMVFAIDPAAPDLATGDVILSATDYGTAFDVCHVSGSDAAAFVATRSGAASYTAGRVTAGLSVSSSTKSRTASGPVAIACTDAGDHLQIVRNVTVSILGDLLDASTLADVYTDQSIGTTTGPDHIAAAHRSTQDGGTYRCYVYWSESSSGTPTWVKSNWVSTANTLGTEDVFKNSAAIASRAFERDGRIYIWLLFANPSTFFTGSTAAQFSYSLQNTYFLLRDDGTQWAKATPGKAGPIHTSGHLPGVQYISGDDYAWCGIERRLISIGGASRRQGYAARSPRSITFSFDSNEARRTVVLGRTLYITGGEILQYDGRQLVEVGFHVFPFTLNVTQTSSGTGPADGTYALKMSWRWDNARGEVERSTAATTGTITIASGPDGIQTIWNTLTFTRKSDPAIAAELWRTAVNPTAEAPFYRVTNNDPNETSNPNRYLENDPTSIAGATFQDEIEDADLTENESHPENGSVLENLAPPAATIITASADRLFLAGVAGDPDRVWYSKLRNDGEIAAFHDALTIPIPREGGAITGLAFLNETLIVFRETAIYAVPGDGYDNTGGGTNYGPARTISNEVGATSHETIALEPRGLVFSSSKGKYLLNRGWGVDYIGGPVSDYDSEEVLAVHVVESQHQIRWLTGSRVLVLDYLVNQWAEWSAASGVSACMWSGVHHYATSALIKAQATTYTGVDYGLDVETAWIKPGDLQGVARLRRVLPLGEYRSAHKLRTRIAFDYATTYTDDKLWTVSPTTVGGPEQVKHGPSKQRCQAFKVRITACGSDSDAPLSSYTAPTGEALKLTGLGLEVGIRPGLHRRIPVAQKVGG